MWEDLPVILIIGTVGIVWIYVVARVITRAVLRTLDERRRNENGEEEKKGHSGAGEGEREKKTWR